MKKVVIALALLIALGAWYAFRPERLFINQKVNEQFPTASAAGNNQTKLATGQFHAGAHETKGTATIFQLGEGKRILRLTNFETSNGPDVHVYLVAAADAKDNETVKSAGFVDLGSLKGNIGDQNYEVPANLDLAKYRAATIWCVRFNVNFGTAPLMNDSMQSMNR
jgi:Electron transfer DM13